MVKIEEAKAFLNQVYKAKQVCLRCNADLEELRSTSSLLVPAYGEHTGDGSLKHDTSDFICKLQQQEDELERLKLEWLNKRIEVSKKCTYFAIRVASKVGRNCMCYKLFF